MREFLRQGSFHLSLFTTLHYDACDILFKMLNEAGLYAYTGLVNMDQNSPDYYVDDTDASLAKTERFIRAKKYDLGVQTHLVESRAEAAWAKELFPEFGSDGQIYESCGLLQGKGPKIFAHVIFPSEVEERILKEYDGISVHCPDATSNITAGIMPASAMHEKGLKIALGSDVGGGHFLGIYRQIARAAQISKMKEFYEEDYRRIKLANAFYMATVTGGSIFDRVGKLEKGYRFNALIIDNMLDEEYVTSLQDALERFCYIGDERNIFERYIDGVRVDPEAVYQKLINM